MAKGKASLETTIAEDYVAPVIMKLLKPYSAFNMAVAINKNVNLAKGLQEDREYLEQIKMLLLGVPFTETLAKKLKQKKWIDWFINNEMLHKKPDIYNQIIYHPKGPRYIRRQIRQIVKVVFS